MTKDYLEELERLTEYFEPLEEENNVKPSEALECLEYIRHFKSGYNSVDDTEEFNTIKQALINAQEMEKVLNVVFRKNFNFELFRNVLLSVGGRFEYKEYEKVYTKYGKEKLTQEEFELVKRYCKENGE